MQYNTSFYISTDYGNNWYLYNKITNNETTSPQPQMPTDSCLSGDGKLLYVIYGNSALSGDDNLLDVFNITVGNKSNPLRYNLGNFYLYNPAVSYNGSIVLGISLSSITYTLS